MPSLNRVNSLCISNTCSRRYTVKSFNILKHEARFENIVLRFLISSESPNSYYKGGRGGRVGARKNRRRRGTGSGRAIRRKRKLLSSFKPRAAGYKSFYFGINNTRSI